MTNDRDKIEEDILSSQKFRVCPRLC